MKNTVLAINGGAKSITLSPRNIFKWPIVTKEDESAVLEVLRAGRMSSTEITKQFEYEFAEWLGMTHALAYPSGTESLRAAMWACGVSAGDEVLCPSLTYWASCAQALTLGASVNFVDIDSETNCIDPNDIEHRIGKNTKVLMLVHYGGYPCDMDRILPIAKKYNLKIIEDVSHAQGGLYKGKMLGTFGDVGAMSLMSGKSFAIGEGGMLVTNKREIWERCIAYGHYERTRATNVWDNGEPNITLPELQPFRGIPLGGYKHRMNQTCSAMGRVQLKYYPERIKEIDRAMNYFADLIEDSPGIKVRRPMKDSGSTMGGWYGAQGAYSSDELGGLSCSRFCEAVRAEGSVCTAGANKPLHTHEIFHSADIFNMGKPTMISFGQRDVRQGSGSLPNTENVPTTTFKIPWFRRYHKDIIEEHAAAYMKVAKNYNELLIFIQ